MKPTVSNSPYKKSRSRKNLESKILSGITSVGAVFAFSLLLYMILDIVLKGMAGLSPALFSWNYTSDNVSLMPAMINTLYMVILTLVVSVPLSIGAALYLCEFTRPGSKFSSLIILAVQTLSGVPSIVFGLFGALFFVQFFHMGYSLLAGSLTMVLMVLPVGIKTTQEALQEVPVSLREASYGLGAGKARTIFKIVLPTAAPGIINGILLCIGRVTGESAALLFTAGSLAKVSTSLFSSGRTLAVHMYALSSEGLHIPQTYATALVLLLLSIGINILSGTLTKNLERKL